MYDHEFPPAKLDQSGPCLLCGSTAGRVRSHVIPAFVTRALRESSATGYLRHSTAPNRRVQGGPWDYMLCEVCEGRFNKWETLFATKVFRPFFEGHRGTIQYGRWLPMFATSLTWRVLAFYRAHPELSHKVIDDWTVTDAAEAAWRDCLVGYKPNPGPFRQHLVKFDRVVNAEGPIPPNINKYLLRSFDCDVMANRKDVIVYAKLSGFMFFGMVNCNRPEAWRGTSLGFNGGLVGGAVQIPNFVYRDFIIVKAAVMARAQASISETQSQRIFDTLKQDPARWASSGTFEAMEADLRLMTTPPQQSN